MSAPVLPLEGRIVLVTGTITGLTRDEARDAVTNLGGTPAPGVTQKVDLIVLGEGAGVSKTAKARTLHIPALDGNTFARLVADPTSWDGQRLGMTFAEYTAAFEPEPTEPPPIANPGHRVGKAVLHAPMDGELRLQVRLGCSCGHKWMRHELWGNDQCPQPDQPTTRGPWASPTLDRNLT